MCDSTSRRDFLRVAGGCAAHLALTAALLPQVRRTALAATPGSRTVALEPWGRLDEVTKGVWALISDPFGGDRTTLSNGAIIAGTRGVLVTEGLFTGAGGAWMAQQAKALTGRWPTHVLLTHHHSDHADGVVGYRTAGEASPRVLASSHTITTVRYRARANADLLAMLADVQPVETSAPGCLDLGGTQVCFSALAGHTASDMAVVHDDARVVVGGDLLWNGIFPNYVDALPSTLTRSAKALQRADARWKFVPGHGALMTSRDVGQYVALLDAVEAAARAAWDRGDTAAAAAAAWTVPESLGAWRLFGPAFMGRAFTSWYQELDGN